MKPLQFILKSRKLALCIACGATSLVIVATLLHFFHPWALLATALIPGLLIEAAIKCQWNRGQCYEKMGRLLVHNTPNVEGQKVPSNAAWDRAVNDIRQEGHLYHNLDAKYDPITDYINVKFLP